MDYTPRIGKVHVVGRLDLGGSSTAVMLDQIESTGLTQYEFVVAIYNAGQSEPVLFVASERDRMWHPGEEGSHYFGVFDDDGHHNLGASNRWADPNKFFPAAMAVACEWLGIEPEAGSSTARGPGAVNAGPTTMPTSDRDG